MKITKIKINIFIIFFKYNKGMQKIKSLFHFFKYEPYVPGEEDILIELATMNQPLRVCYDKKGKHVQCYLNLSPQKGEKERLWVPGIEGYTSKSLRVDVKNTNSNKIILMGSFEYLSWRLVITRDKKKNTYKAKLRIGDKVYDEHVLLPGKKE